MATRKTTATKAKQEAPAKAEATEPKAEPAPETPADAVAPDTDQDAQANAEAASTAEATEAKDAPVPEAQTPADAVAANPEPAAAPQPTEIQGNTVSGGGTGNALPPMEEIPGVFVRTKRRIKSRRRAGFRFNREGTSIALELLSQEQLEQLLADPALQVTNCNLSLDEATSEPEA
ncbi:HI1506-related protein [Halomonas campaniensis]|uniref:HI1506-related protein n=1 Tax=Halomonas campaniensis TaxID=213554 RepID=UPI000B52E9D8|nr:HI1506-related protein [Halomonas campaniensis]